MQHYETNTYCHPHTRGNIMFHGQAMRTMECEDDDFDAILDLYHYARQLQTEKKAVVWQSFEDDLLLREIRESRQWKITDGDAIACNWAITYEDKEIWGDKDMNDSIFIHRICTHPAYRGNRFIDQIVSWAMQYATERQKRYIRLDTSGSNIKLIEHYISAGFKSLGIFRLAETENLPAHYQGEPRCCLLEIKL